MAQLENQFLPWFKEAAAELEREHSSLKFNVGTSSVGGATEYQGYIIWLESTFPDAAAHEADSVAAIISVHHLTTEPMLSSVSVEWGNGQHPNASVEFIEHAAPLTEASLNEVTSRLPELFAFFRTALQAWGNRNASA